MNARAFVTLAGFIVLAGCKDQTPQPPLTPPRAAAPAPSNPPAPPPAAAPAPTPTPALERTVTAMGVSLALPEGWTRRPPANSMRLAEAEVADPAGDPANACLVVFSTAGGTVQDNVTRWAGQVRDPQGNPAKADTKTRAVGGTNITIVEMTGTFAGMGDSEPKPDWTLRGAILEAPQGLLFIKMTGPAAPMRAAGDGFSRLLDSTQKP